MGPGMGPGMGGPYGDMGMMGGPSGSPNNIGSPMGHNNHMGPGMQSPNHMGGGPMPGVPVSKSSPMGDPMQPIPPGPPGPPGMNGPGYKNNLLMGGPTTQDPAYAQQFHDFQQQLYATNTNRHSRGGPPGAGPMPPNMPPGAAGAPGGGQNFYPGPGGGGNGPSWFPPPLAPLAPLAGTKRKKPYYLD